MKTDVSRVTDSREKITEAVRHAGKKSILGKWMYHSNHTGIEFYPESVPPYTRYELT